MDKTLDQLREELAEYREKEIAVKGGGGLMGRHIVLRALDIAIETTEHRIAVRERELQICVEQAEYERKRFSRKAIAETWRRIRASRAELDRHKKAMGENNGR